MSKTIEPITTVAIFMMVAVSFAACKTRNQLSYFQNLPRDTVLQNTVSKNFDLKIKPDDLLAIGISSASLEQAALFNAAQAGGSGGAGAAAGYLVDKKGNIQLYKLGDVKLAGLTRDEAKEKLGKELSPYLKDPVVTVRFANHQVIVLGAVASPGALPMTTDQMTVLEVIGKSGDLTEKAKRANVLVIRQTEAGKEFRHLNLLDNSIFSSPYFYLQNEDVVYVEPETKRSAEKNAQLISYVVSGISLLTFLLSRIIK